ncbi:PTS sugar transporter subunit IIA [Vibrio neonatus]|uniref:PTS sugar transporter subunit IIA n=1 Tax=Vibrio neonatus TaxID=278860 RepID=UPI0021C37735|nr:PTS sugar transporter subunit IIA [Vibrio neonatus]
MLEELINVELINVNIVSKNKQDLFKELAAPLLKESRIKDLDVFLKGIETREAQCTTTTDGIAYPHCKSETVISPAISVGIAPDGIEYDQDDDEPQPKVFFMIASPADSDYHIEILKALFVKFDPEFVTNLCNANSAQDALNIIKKD